MTIDGFGSALSDLGEAVGIQQGDGSSVEGEHAFIAKDPEQTDGGFNGNPGHLGDFFPFEGESDPDMIILFLPESITEFQQQAGQSLTGALECELVEMIHVDPHFVAEELDQLDRQLRIFLDDREVAFLIDDAHLGGFQSLARDFVKGSLAEDVFLDHLTGAYDADDLPPTPRRRAGELDLARA